MLIEPELIIAWGGASRVYKKGEFIFKEGELCRFYYQIVEGAVKVFNTNIEGREFTQGIFYVGESFGEPPLIINSPYPTSAKTTKNSVILRLQREIYFNLLDEYPELQKKMISLLASRAYAKAISAKIIINNTPEVRILSFLDYYKAKHGFGKDKILIPYTRQEIANLTGLRVETTIRTLSRLNEEGKVEISERKLYY